MLKRLGMRMSHEEFILALLLLTGTPQTARAQIELQVAAGNFALPTRTLRDIPFRSVIRQQYDYSCGSAALATLLRYHYGRMVDEAGVFKAMYESGGPTCRCAARQGGSCMSSGFHKVLPLLLLLAGCEREQRDFHAPPPSDPKGDHYQLNAFDVGRGKRLYTWMNCVGCHAHGGGGMGPALMDARWIYGGSIQQIYSSIRDGRRNGMPAWKHRLTDQQIWQLAAYVRSMGRYVRKDVAPSRDDALNSGKAESRRPRTAPVDGEARPL